VSESFAGEGEGHKSWILSKILTDEQKQVEEQCGLAGGVFETLGIAFLCVQLVGRPLHLMFWCKNISLRDTVPAIPELLVRLQPVQPEYKKAKYERFRI
jgi:hypothetical protein